MTTEIIILIILGAIGVICSILFIWVLFAGINRGTINREDLRDFVFMNYFIKQVNDYTEPDD